MPPRRAESPQLRSTGVEVQGTASGASLPEIEPWLCSLYAVGPWTSTYSFCASISSPVKWR